MSIAIDCTYAHVLKANPYRDRQGLFTSKELAANGFHPSPEIAVPKEQTSAERWGKEYEGTEVSGLKSPRYANKSLTEEIVQSVRSRYPKSDIKSTYDTENVHPADRETWESLSLQYRDATGMDIVILKEAGKITYYAVKTPEGASNNPLLPENVGITDMTSDGVYARLMGVAEGVRMNPRNLNVMGFKKARQWLIAYKVATEMGYDPDNIDVRTYDKKFIVADTEFSEGGHYSKDTGRITLKERDTKGKLDQGMEGLVAHEVTHHAFNTVLLKGASPPVVEFLKQLESSWATLASEDGVTDYSKSYWRNVQKQVLEDRRILARVTAVNETLAEISSLRYAQADMSPEQRTVISATWTRLHSSLFSIYKDMRKKSVV